MDCLTKDIGVLTLPTSGKKHARDIDPISLEGDGSRDSGLGSDDDHHSDSSFISLMTVRRKLPIFDEDACSPLKYSPIKNSASPVDFRSISLISKDSDDCPSFLKSRVRLYYEDEIKDEDNIGKDNKYEDRGLPKCYKKLFIAPLLESYRQPVGMFKANTQTEKAVLENILSPNCRPRLSQKRLRADKDGDQSSVLKRRREMGLSERSHSLTLPPPARNTLKKWHTQSETIKTTLDRVVDHDDLIGDGSQTCSLPTIPGKHEDLKSISPETLSKVLSDEYDHSIGQLVIVDCRYPYEYNGGHIKGAQNLYTKDLIMEKLVKTAVQTREDCKRTVLIFHCEFSSKRAPKMCRYLRNMDRSLNKERYPELFFPEMYVLNGGYKEFYQNKKELCSPQTYTPMLHEDYKDELRVCRQKSKSWSGDEKRKSLCKRKMSLRL